MTHIKQVYESMGVDTHGIWNKQLAEAFKDSDVETIRMCLHAILGAIKQASSIDIVRCKECKHWQTDWNSEEGVDNFHFCPMVDRSTFDDWFCADGERKE